MLYVILNVRLGYVDSYIYICKLISKMKLTFNFARILESTTAVDEVVFVDDIFFNCLNDRIVAYICT